VSLFVADTWAAVLLIYPPYTYPTGGLPDLFWFTCYLLIPLAAVVKWRLAPELVVSSPVAPPERVTLRDFWAGLLFVLPSMVVVGASVVIILTAVMTEPSRSDVIIPLAVGIALLLLATMRPAVMYLEQKQLRREREAARAQETALRLANQRMEEFLGVVSHELRTPLTSLFGNVQLMGRRVDALLSLEGSREDYTRAAALLRTIVERCEHGLRRMGRLIEDLLDETRIRQSRLELRLAPCDLTTVVCDVVEDQVLLYPTRTIRWVGPSQPVPVIADASRIEQVVMNYVTNALKFSRDDKAIEVSLATADGMACVTVHDQGIGISRAEQAQVFERFHQAAGTAVQSGSQVGLGIGLYISKTIVERHHGQVGVDSASGQGSTFWFTLPLASVGPASEYPCPADGQAAGLDGEHNLL
jgi:signal transduction histidine kinase